MNKEKQQLIDRLEKTQKLWLNSKESIEKLKKEYIRVEKTNDLSRLKELNKLNEEWNNIINNFQKNNDEMIKKLNILKI